MKPAAIPKPNPAAAITSQLIIELFFFCELLDPSGVRYWYRLTSSCSYLFLTYAFTTRCSFCSILLCSTFFPSEKTCVLTRLSNGRLSLSGDADDPLSIRCLAPFTTIGNFLL